MSRKKSIISLLIFLIIFIFTYKILFQGQDINSICNAVKKAGWIYTASASLLGVFYVSMEGVMIWYLLCSMKEKTSVFHCIQYSFIGFFYSAITPSATGGQPVQLYYMSKDGIKGSHSTVTLMTVAVAYKLVLVLIGIGLLLFWYTPLRYYLNNYFFLYIVGLLVNVVVVAFVLAVMLHPDFIISCSKRIVSFLANIGIIKNKSKCIMKIEEFVESYKQAVDFLKVQYKKLSCILLMTFVQRCSMFLILYIVYLGFNLNTVSFTTIFCFQAAIYVTVDMLPIPGAQGITELVYKSVFTGLFMNCLIPSMLISRAANFYILFIISILVVLYKHIKQSFVVE